MFFLASLLCYIKMGNFYGYLFKAGNMYPDFSDFFVSMWVEGVQKRIFQLQQHMTEQ